MVYDGKNLWNKNAINVLSFLCKGQIVTKSCRDYQIKHLPNARVYELQT